MLSRQFQAYHLRISGYTIDEIAYALGVSATTVKCDLKAEGTRRANELTSARSEQVAAALAFVDIVTKRLMPRGGASLDPATAATLLKANEQRIKILGLEAPRQIEAAIGTQYPPGQNPLEGMSLEDRRLLLGRAAARQRRNAMLDGQ